MVKRLWRPDDWYTEYPDACMSCPNVSEDEWGKLCDLPCGEYTARSNFEAGVDAGIKAVLKFLNLNSSTYGAKCGEKGSKIIFILPEDLKKLEEVTND